MHCCHLDLSTDNIIISGTPTFITNDKNDKVNINPKISVKVGDFGLAEIFKCSSYEEKDNEYFEFDSGDPDKINPFHCLKTGITDTQQYKPPKVFKGEVYDARKSDIFSLGIVLFQLCVGYFPYKYPNKEDFGYVCVKDRKIDIWLKNKNISQYVPSKCVSLLHSMLNMTESKRFNIENVMKHQWLSTYHRSYSHKIVKKSQLQRKRNMKRQLNNNDAFPYYKLSTSELYNL